MVGLLFGQFIKPDIGFVVDVVHFLDIFSTSPAKVNQFQDDPIQADDSRYNDYGKFVEEGEHESDGKVFSSPT